MENAEGEEDTKWARVDLILDEICKNLSVADLKQVRLLNKSFCEAASKLLARKTLIRLTGIVDLRPVAEKVPALISHCSTDSDFFLCGCGLKVTSEYNYIDSYKKHLDSASNQRLFIVPKNVSVLSSSDVWLLPESHFSRLEQLQVVTFRPSEGLRILVEFPRLFPNLKKLELKYIQRDVGDGETGTRNWTSMPIEDDKEQRAEIQLEELAITVAAYWAFVGSSVFQKLRKLKTLKLLWSGDFPFWVYKPDAIRYNEDGDLFGGWLQCFQSGFSMLNDVSFRLDLTPGNLTGAPQVLNSMRLEKLSLEVYGHNSEFARFILGLQPRTVTALAKVHLGSGWLRGDLNICPHVTEAVTWLCDSGFLDRIEWELTFQHLDGWLSIIKTETQLVQQISSTIDYCIVRNILSKHPEFASKYNYTLRRFRLDFEVTRYKYERFQPVDHFFACEAYPMQSCRFFHHGCVTPDWHWRTSIRARRRKHCECPRLCRKPTVLLCENPKFLDQVGISFPHEHLSVNEYPISTDIFCYVKADVIKEWFDCREQYYKEMSETNCDGCQQWNEATPNREPEWL